MEVFVDVEGGVLEYVEPEIAGVCFGAKLEGVVADEFVVDLYLDDGGFLLLSHPDIINCGV